MSFPVSGMTEDVERELLQDVIDIGRLEVNTRPPAPLALYQPHAELQAWADTLELATTDEERAEIQARIAEYLAQGKHAVDQFNAGWAFLDSQIELCKVELDRIDAFVRRLARIQQTMEASAIKTMEALGTKRLEGNTSFLRIQARPPAVEVTCAADVPIEYKVATVKMPAAEAESIAQFFPDATVTHVVSLTAVGAVLKAGKEVPGARLIKNDDRGCGHNSLRRK